MMREIMNAAKTSAAEKTIAPAPELTGYSTDVTLFASRYKQGGRTVYSLDLSPSQITSIVTEPDINTVSPGNRAIRPAHADSFGKYLREREDWVSPSLMLRSPTPFELDVQNEVGPLQFGFLSIPRRSLVDLHIVDGQHRILGMFRAEKAIAADIDKARSALATARRNEGAGSTSEKEIRKAIAQLEHERTRLETEIIHTAVYVEADPASYRQMFFDVADNALGITASVKTRFDSRKVVHRAREATMEHRLLVDRVDPEGDRMGRGSPFIMGAKHVAEVIRTVNVGLDGRVSRRQEVEFDEKELAARTIVFLDLMLDSFPQLQELVLGKSTADDLRRHSMLGSVLFFRVLGGAFFELLTEHAYTPEMIGEFFVKLAPHVIAPVYAESIWIADAPAGLFSVGSGSPHGRRQDLKQLKDTLVAWALDKPAFLEGPPAPRPEPELEEVSSEEEMRIVDEILALTVPKK
ncbi:DNA sulfur modification protein DndB [Frigoribacterium sp. UYMn621]|uniref:DNA sulfur modification protein DndB n=1 Tax=Frigoribacterium sp. UYMn621 TaxID=3156343 RepID=UPI003398F0B1